jgi:hypothetical protein
MTAVALFDALSEEPRGPKLADAEILSRRAAMAEKLVASALNDLKRIGEYERLCASTATTEPPSLTPALGNSLHDLYTQWVSEADAIALRARTLQGQGVRIVAADKLDDAIGQTRARVSVTPEQIALATAQARQGQFVPSRELRDELRARLRT